MSVRRVSNHGGNVIGKFPSIKMKRLLAFESLIERDYLYLLDYDPDVEWFEEQPLTIAYQHEDKTLHYTPDFHLVDKGRDVLVECKPDKFVTTNENRRKFAAARDWCMERGWEFRTVTDLQVQAGCRLRNVKLLTRYARQSVDPDIRWRIYALLHDSQSRPTIAHVARAIPPYTPDTITASILHMAFHHGLFVPLDDSVCRNNDWPSSADSREEAIMSARRLSTRSRFRWQGITYEVKRLLPGRQVNIEALLTGSSLVVELSTLVQALFGGELAFAIEGKSAKREAKEEISTENRYVTLDDCPEHLLRIARRRLRIIEPLLAVEPRTEAMIRDRVQEIRAISSPNAPEHMLEDAVSVRSMYRWLDDYTRSGHDLRALVPSTRKRGGKGQSRLALEVEAMLNSVIEDKYYVRERVTTDDIRAELAVRLAEENLQRTYWTWWTEDN
jgi:hypothetical protein